MHVLAIVPYFYPHIGGGETHLRQLAEQLVRRGHGVTVLTQGLAGSPAHERIGAIEVRRFGRIGSPGGRRAAYLGILEEVTRWKRRPTVVYLFLSVGSDYCTDLICEALATARRIGLPRLVRIPSSGRVVELEGVHPPGLDELRRADGVIALNAGIHAELIDCGVAPERIHRIRNGVDTALFRPSQRAPDDPVPSRERPVLLCPTRFVAKKRLEDLIGIWRDLRVAGRRRPAPELWLVGDPGTRSEHAAVSARVRRLARPLAPDGVKIFDAAPHDEMPRFYRAASAYICASLQEGMSNSLLEAMACALPVIAPRTEAVVPLVREGRNGFLYAPGDRGSASQAVERFLRAEPRQLRAMGRRSREAIRSRHRLGQMVARFEALFQRLATSPSETTPCAS